MLSYRILTYDGAVLEEDVVALTAADLEDKLADVEQVVAADAHLKQKACFRKRPARNPGPGTRADDSRQGRARRRAG